MKEIKVTDSYLGLSMEDKGCQNEVAVEDCTTNMYIDTLLEQCGCLPLRIVNLKDVNTTFLKRYYGNLSILLF